MQNLKKIYQLGVIIKFLIKYFSLFHHYLQLYLCRLCSSYFDCVIFFNKYSFMLNNAKNIKPAHKTDKTIKTVLYLSSKISFICRNLIFNLELQYLFNISSKLDEFLNHNLIDFMLFFLRFVFKFSIEFLYLKFIAFYLFTILLLACFALICD